MKLFGEIIGWRANKQDTVTTSTTEAELLALAQAAKEAMLISRLIRELDPRDHVFAFLGHPSALDDTTGELLVHPDYKKSVIDEYYEAACALVKILELTFALSCVDRDQATLDSDFLSWVPQWHLAKNVCALGYSTHWYYRDFKIRNSDRSTPIVERIWRDLAAHEGDDAPYGAGDRVDAFSLTLVANVQQIQDKNGQIAAQHHESFKSYCAKFGCAVEGIDLEGSKTE
ncbi:hypothetical protein CIB48_g9887 [Xylaria polymorpha]|nr:hypothetical protein CIB48_g9887 [Xylaria polymorpha]